MEFTGRLGEIGIPMDGRHTMHCEITYLYHNCFILSLNGKNLLFDYPRVGYSNRHALQTFQKILREKELHIFVSHSHPDHYNPDIYTFASFNPDITFHLASDIPQNDIPQNLRSCTYIYQSGSVHSCKGVSADALESNDQGVAFLIHVYDRTIYFGGDLADWAWEDFTPEEKLHIEVLFSRMLERLSLQPVHIAFSNADPRLPNLSGIQRFSRAAHPKILVPMHLFGRTSSLTDISKNLNDPNVRVFAYHKPMDRISFDL